MGKSIAYQSTIAIEVTECKCVNATLHRKRDFILLPSGLKSGKLLGCKLFTETVSSFVFHIHILEPKNCTVIDNILYGRCVNLLWQNPSVEGRCVKHVAGVIE